MITGITSALRVLYGKEFPASPDLLETLHLDVLKSVFRQRAMELHPDRANIVGKNRDEMSKAFKDVKLAYETLLDLLGPSSFDETMSTAPTEEFSKPCGPGDDYWEGRIPEVSLLFGQFLYYAGLITFDNMVSAVMWQRRQRPSFGKIARTWEYLSADAVRTILSSRRSGEKIGEAALRLGFLNLFQRNTVLGFQKYLQRPIGRFFLENGFLEEDEIDYLVTLLRKHNRDVGGVDRTGGRWRD